VSPVSLEREILFYDGTCALCHRAVLFVLRHDRQGKLFRFAPLGGETFVAETPPEQRAGLPDSVVVKTLDGLLLVRSNAFLHICERIGGGWKLLANVLRVIPRPIRDVVYDFVARVRYRIFGRTKDWCPVMPPELRARFDP
jgi:predicted DCC family thiol-disulfide oxidoreductase YuxK